MQVQPLEPVARGADPILPMHDDLFPDPYAGRPLRRRIDEGTKRMVDLMLAASMLLLLLPVIALVALAIKIDSAGPILYRCRRVGYKARELQMLKFRKMQDSAKGPALTISEDDRFTRVGRFLALSKLDELPQLWNVVKGEMSLVGPRPEDPYFVSLHPEAYKRITGVRPGVTGLSQLAFAEESRILDPDDSVGHYLDRLLPQKTGMDQLYAARRTVLLDARILLWTTAAVVLRRDVAVHRRTGAMNLRRRPKEAPAPAPLAQTAEHTVVTEGTPADAQA